LIRLSVSARVAPAPARRFGSETAEKVHSM